MVEGITMVLIKDILFVALVLDMMMSLQLKLCLVYSVLERKTIYISNMLEYKQYNYGKIIPVKLLSAVRNS